MSRGEELLLIQLRAAGYPEPVRQHPFKLPPKAPGRPRRTVHLDLAYPDLLLAVEVQGGTWSGGTHVRGAGYAANCEKATRLQIAGWLVVTATTDQVESGLALALIEEALAARHDAARAVG